MEETKKHIILAELLAKEIANKLTEDEKEQLNLFLSDESQAHLIASARKSMVDQAKLNRYKAFDVEAARQKIEWKINFRKKNRRIRLMNFVRYAAIISLPIALAGWLIYTSVFVNGPQIAQAPIEIKPGGSKAMLYLSDGRAVDLERKNENHIKETDGSLILKDSTGLNYTIQPYEIKEAKIHENVVVTPAGGEYQLTLSDGTKVWMNALSEIRYPVKFSGNTRKVTVSGEVLFDVAKNKDKPFYVSVGDMDIRVLGTQFNVMAYPDEENIETTLIEGAVRLMGQNLDGSHSSVDLTPGHKADFNRATKSVDVKAVDTDVYTSWRDGKFVFQSEPLDDIMRKMERWYNVKVFFENQDLKDLRFSARLSRYGDIEDILYKMEQTTRVKFIIKDDHVIIRRR
ncbi:FecR family protein [Ancylomarina euxinus]|uniref:FecR family protein n=1 Tax=Ancylomarina euxinus TaxID=2283627 RepID=A0A425XY48_9BACT|nr:FecR family protein [Ancylomarina euxinus]MCZ4695952.1 FecR family protein [Ancylomarina euxinus]MUP16324.1 DUF4974 domain-containing protein [Ancylomarina euxinus]RRG19720.1 FecR family protein [Ancylomarina euxinus]